MDLEERIARLISPQWEEHPDAATTPAYQRTALAAARRVIDGLNLDIISSHHSLDGRRHRYDLSGHFREDS